jgi:aconitate hydratase
MFADYANGEWPAYPDVITLDLSTIEPTLAGPKRPHDAVKLKTMKEDFNSCLTNKVGFKGYGLPEAELSNSAVVEVNGQNHTLTHGSVVIAAITSCTNTSNPSVLIAAGLLAKKAVEKGLTTKPYVKTSLAPGSHVVTKYLEACGLQKHLVRGSL